MWLLAFAIVALMIGADLRNRGREVGNAGPDGAGPYFNEHDANAIGAWISFMGGVCLNIAVWQIF